MCVCVCRVVALGPASQAMAGPFFFFEEFLIFISTVHSMGVVSFIHINVCTFEYY